MSLPPDMQSESHTVPEVTGVRAFQAGEVIFQQGEPSRELYLLEEGTVRLVKKVRELERSLAVLRPGALFGESALVPGALRASAAVAVTPGVATILHRASLPAVLARDPVAGAQKIAALAARIDEAEEQIELLMLTDATSKVVNTLLRLAERVQGEGPGAVFAVSPLELAARTGIDVDAVKHVVQELREGQYLQVLDTRLEVPDVNALRRLYALLGVKQKLRTEA